MQNQVRPDVASVRAADFPADAAFLNRWSPRAFSPAPVPDELLMGVFEAARWAASSYNEQPWRFLLARTDPDRARFSECIGSYNRVWSDRAPVLILIVAKRTFSHNGSPNPTHEYDAGTASGYLALQASLSGLAMHGMAGFDRDKARELLHIPDDFTPLAVYALGYPGDKADLPEPLQAREIPSGRRPAPESVMEGGFKPKTEEAAEDDTQNVSHSAGLPKPDR